MGNFHYQPVLKQFPSCRVSGGQNHVKVMWEAVAPLPRPTREMSWRPSGEPEILPPFSSNEAALGLKRDQVGNLDLYPQLTVSASPTDTVLWRAAKTEDQDKI